MWCFEGIARGLRRVEKSGLMCLHRSRCRRINRIGDLYSMVVTELIMLAVAPPSTRVLRV